MDRAFTLIEILVVVTIIGLITIAGIISYSQFLKQSRDAKRKADIELIRGALEMYRSNNNKYPQPAEVTGSIKDPLPATNIYINKTPSDPKSPSVYWFTSDIAGSTYTLGIKLESQAGTSSCGDCGGAVVCDYCMGPYGQY